MIPDDELRKLAEDVPQKDGWESGTITANGEPYGDQAFVSVHYGSMAWVDAPNVFIQDEKQKRDAALVYANFIAAASPEKILELLDRIVELEEKLADIADCMSERDL